ncbi:MAG TPA: S8 family serine peptidase, partial [Phytomonospora sp.]
MRIRPALVLLTCLGLAGAALTAAPPPALADPPDAPVGDRGGPAVAVRLITGDTVHLYPGGSVGFRPGEGREGIGYSRTFAPDGSGDVVVVPADAAAGLADGVLDPRLFNVTRLAADGHGGAETLPLIVETAGEGAHERRRPGVEKAGATLDSIGAEAVTVSTVDGAWWSSWTSARGAAAHVWLDGTARVALDVSVPQVGAPAAWDAGYDGEGVTVAVLDSGYDQDHPDLGGVTDAADFTGTSPDAVDGNGHGTHVASIVAGTGTASGGRYTGVAPGAGLLIGKVCGDDGFCDESAMIAGMEWAAHGGADVVNMSVGGYPSDGTGPVEQALNMLTEHTGTLFVVSAGNYGAPRMIGSPGAADAALTVGSVQKDDTLSESSSRGPRLGDGAVKPDITAPGGSITAARASGTSMGTPVDEHHTTESGTSMASPHVAGGAALLKQAHPDWTAARLKAALMGAAHPLDGLTPYEQGTGRLDLARAVTGPLSTTAGSLSFGLYAWPHQQPAASRTVTYANSGDTPLHLSQSVTGANAKGTAIPAGLFTLDTPTLTVPAGGDADVVLTLHPSADAVLGLIGAALVATDGAHTARTAVGLDLERELHTLTLTPKARPGDRLDGIDAAWANLDTGESGYITAWDTGYVGTVRLSPGRYQLYGTVRTDGTQQRLTVFDTRTTVTAGDTATTWDTARGVRSKVALDRATSYREANVTLSVGATGIGANTTGAVFVVSAGSAPGTRLFYSYQPVHRAVGGAKTTHVYTLYFPTAGGLPAQPAYTARDRDLS